VDRRDDEPSHTQPGEPVAEPPIRGGRAPDLHRGAQDREPGVAPALGDDAPAPIAHRQQALLRVPDDADPGLDAAHDVN
jgi:hypothetical protein